MSAPVEPTDSRIDARDPFARLRAATRARIGLGRAGDAQPTEAVLAFQAAHSRARDAVHGSVDFDALGAALAPRPHLVVHSRAGDRHEYLRRPDLGRRVREDDLATLAGARGDFDLAVVVADGLSAAAIDAHAAPMLRAIEAQFADWSLAPLVFGRQARVAFGDEVAQTLGARMVAVLIGERPGLTVADSLGIYLTFAPTIGCADSKRNCISNVHAHGLSYTDAAATLVWLAEKARRRESTGVSLKVDASAVARRRLPGAAQNAS